jgi:hypothetical protein
MLVTLCKAMYFSAVMKVPFSRGSCTSRSNPHFSHASGIHWRGSELVVIPASSQSAAAYPFGRIRLNLMIIKVGAAANPGDDPDRHRSRDLAQGVQGELAH